MKKIILAFIFLLIFGSLKAQQAISIVSSELKFSIQNAGVTVNGTLSGLKGEISFDPEKYTTAIIDVSVPVSTIKTGIAMRDAHIKKAEYFDAAKFPEISLKSSFFGKRNNQFIGYFMLTLKGVSKNVSIPFTATIQNGLMVLEGEFAIDRLEYKIGGKSLVMGNEVKVKIKVIVKP